jgi:hypothetical protein
MTPDLAEELGNAATLVSSWLEGVFEFTNLKNEIIVIKLKQGRVMERIRRVQTFWPKIKNFIEGAYKLLIFTKLQRKQVS